jgi:antitoxin (DNA-binding transcriptional repressor) of toxin-antitoxin stability system
MRRQIDIPSLTPETVRAAIASGETVLLQRDGRVVAELTPTPPGDPGTGDVPKVGFMKGEISIPEDFDRLFEHEIADLFEKGRLFPQSLNKPRT